MSISVSVDTTKLDAIIKQIPGNRDKIVKETAAHVLSVSKQTTAYKNVSGELRDNNQIVPEGKGVWNVEYYQEYAPYVELGTWKMAARPFLRPAVEAETELLTKRIKEGLIQK